MRLLHTSDWHLGKVLKGQSRVDEQLAVLKEIVEIAERERPDLVIVAGDLYDTGAPNAETEKIAVRALSALRRHAAAVVVIAGNHDHGPRLDALRSWADDAGITLRGMLSRPDDHVISGVTPQGEAWRLAALPFVSQRYAIRASEMFDLTAAEASATYADHVARLIAALTEGWADDKSDGDGETINLVTAHLTVVGAKTGGGERDVHTIEAYCVPSTVFPSSLHYVALGHLHRRQQVPGPAPVHYSGSPLAVDFGEEENHPSVSLVELSARQAAKVRAVRLQSAVPLRTVRGSLGELATMDIDPSAWLRVYVRESPRAGLKQEVQELAPRALEVRIDPQSLPALTRAGRPANAAARSPRELFGEYLTARGVADPAVGALFNEIYEECTAPGASSRGAAGRVVTR